MKKLSILLVDDALEICAQATRWLSDHHTACVNSGADALTALSLLHFDVVVVDVMTPTINRLGVVRRLRDAQPWVRILATTKDRRFRSDLERSTHAHDLGVDEVLQKPFDEIQFHTALRNAVALRSLQLN